MIKYIGYDFKVVNVMSINAEELKSELKKLQETKDWLKKETAIIEKNDIELNNKIAALRKEARGRYNEELETKQMLYEITHRNFQNYNEAKEVPYFARIDFRELRRDFEQFYIGKFGLADAKTWDEKVIDWRSPIADLYYSGTKGNVSYEAPLGIIDGELSLKRKFLMRNGELVNAFDEGINQIIMKSESDNSDEKVLMDEYLRISLEESISSKLKDVVATIQKEQNDIIRAMKNQAIIVQGSAGSGKTTVALHRLAYLLYKYKSRISGKDILVVAPNKLFLDYISEVLPNLGIDKVKQMTFDEIGLEAINIKAKIYTKESKLADILEGNSGEDVKYIIEASRFKGTLSFKILLDRFIKCIETLDSDVSDIKAGNITLFGKEELKRLFTIDLLHQPINIRKKDIKRYFSLKLNNKIANILDKIDFTYEHSMSEIKANVEDEVKRREQLVILYEERDEKKNQFTKLAKKEFTEYFKNWERIDIVKLYNDFFNNKELFDKITENKIPENLYTYMKLKLNGNSESGVIDTDDIAAMMYLKFKIEGILEKSKYNHIVIDEAQDYSMLQLFVLKSMAINNSCTIVGDLGQSIYYYKGIESWDKLIKNVFEGEGSYLPLNQSYRSTVEIINFANGVLEKQELDIKPAVPVLRHGPEPSVIEFTGIKEFCAKLDEIVAEIKAKGKNTVAVIGKTYNECKEIKEYLKKYSIYKWDIIKDNEKAIKFENLIIPSYMTKGLEFDCSVIFNCSQQNYSDSKLDKKILYVALTRALHMEYIFYNGVKSNLIGA